MFNGEFARRVLTERTPLPKVRGAGKFDPGHLAIRLARGLASAEEGECWLWTKSKPPSGYGLLTFGTHNTYAHRMSWTLTHGPIPEGMFVLHRCDVRACVNPAHLFLGTHADNMRDCSDKGRAHPPPWVPGERQGLSKVTGADVLFMRQEMANGRRGRDMARRFGLSEAAVSAIKRRKTWKHI